MTSAAAQQTHVNWDELYALYGERIARLEAFMESFEAEQPFVLTPSAIDVLFLPVVEAFDRDIDVDEADVAATWQRLLRNMAHDPDPRDAPHGIRSVWSALRAIATEWCDIPPICR